MGCGGLNLWTLFLSAYMAGGWGYRPYFENYTVDASILDSSRIFLARVTLRSVHPLVGWNDLVNLVPFVVRDRFELM
jgi:hypothetical protein